MLLEAWASSAGFQCVFHQPVIDGFIVGYFGNLDEPFDMLKLFIIPWQMKAKLAAAGSGLSHALVMLCLAIPGMTVCCKPWTVTLFMVSTIQAELENLA